MDCFPRWLQRITAQRYGPNFQGDIPYPVYQVQPAVLDANNPVSSSIMADDAFYQSVSGQIALNVLPNRIVHIQPMNVFDTITVCAFSAPAGAVGPPTVPDIAPPIFFSFDKPGRITSEAPIQGSVEAFLGTANAFDPNDFSSYPNCVIVPPTELNGALNKIAVAYTTAFIETVKTNRPFYVWFNDGIATPPNGTSATEVCFKIAWYVQGR